MKRFALFCLLFMPLALAAQKQYFLPTATSSDEEKDKPMIEVYLPKEPNGCAIVLCPGGAMRWLSWESDVVKMASFLNKHGIAAIGLRYHLNKAPMPQGMRMPPMVDDADEWHISKDKIGFLGFSAGGGVAIAATMTADSMERPDFLCTNFGPSLMPVTVTQDAPPVLIMTRADHPNVAAGRVALFMEWKKAGANAELHMYGDGKGPYELMPQTDETTTETWSNQMIHWLKAKGFVKKN